MRAISTPRKLQHSCKLLLASMLIAFAMLVQVPLARSYTADATVAVAPPTVTIGVGQSFAVNLTVTSVSDLYGWELNLSWNPFLIDAVAVVEGPFLRSGGGDAFFTYKLNSTMGYLTLDETLLGMVAGVTGDGTLATITYYVKNLGQCSLHFENVLLLDANETPIPTSTVDGYGNFTPQHDVAITNVNCFPTAVFPGQTVNINITAQNQGGFDETFNVTGYVNSEAIGVQSTFLAAGSSTTIQFTWNTTDYETAEYTITSSASIVPGEVDTSDNTRVADEPVAILYNGHNVAVVDLHAFKSVVGQNYGTYVNLTLRNLGVFPESFSTRAYANGTLIQTLVASLISAERQTLTFEWNTGGFAYGNYTIQAVADQVANETHTTDNSRFGDIPIHVGVPGDLTGSVPDVPDKIVDVRDVTYCILLFFTTPSSPNWKPNADINNDGVVNVKEVTITILNFRHTE